ncbi:SixA phosphatase family protein [Psychroserpens sp. Hel_I_66]|uniref:SixA phosphatase family protein n=1 Tax=Psychroserpens sp. Hel_I_66 TaxID=1250004 RepID=UPI000648D341|nr:phosphoglycerate mutase family protein [Psychroserpens sp. Hel_I_66]
MKSVLSLAIVIILSFQSCAQDVKSNNDVKPSNEKTTYYFIRHAEKDRRNDSNRNPDLNKLGQKRAKKWAKYFKKINLDAVYATNYNRTQQTAQPTAEQKNLDVLDYDASTLYSEEFKNATKGKTVLIVGHSNTTPAFVNMILGDKKYEDIDDNDNSQLFIVTISEDKITDELKTVK